MDEWSIIIGLACVGILIALQRQYEKRRKNNILSTYDALQASNIGKERQRRKSRAETRTKRKYRKNTTRQRKRTRSLGERQRKTEGKKQEQEPEPKQREEEIQEVENTILPIENNTPNDREKESKKLLMSCKDDTDRIDGVSYETYLKIQQEWDAEKEKPKISPIQQQDWDSTLVYGAPVSLSKTTHTIAELDSVLRELDQIIDFLHQSESEEFPRKRNPSKYREMFREKVDRAFNQDNSTIDEIDRILDELDISLPENLLRHNEFPAESPEMDGELPDSPISPSDESATIETFKKLLGMRQSPPPQF